MTNEVIHTSLAAAGYSIDVDPATQQVVVRDPALLRSHGIDALVFLAVFGSAARQTAARWLIWETAQALGIRPATLHDLYRRRAEIPHAFATPALNLRTMSYDLARAAFRAAMQAGSGVLMFELSRGEIAHTDQRPAEYTSAILAGAIKEGFRGPVFLQGDHFQVHARSYAANADAEIAVLRNLIGEALQAGFFNIELDTSALLDPSPGTAGERQQVCARLCALLSDYVRAHEPAGVTADIGAEIGKPGAQGDSVTELRAFMDTCLQHASRQPGLSKVAMHRVIALGATGLPAGETAPATLDAETLKQLACAARDEYNMAGAVQHGGSAQPPDGLHGLVDAGVIEVHMATAFQNLVFDLLPPGSASDVDHWLLKNAAAMRRPGETDAQLIHRTRRLATGPFKKQLWFLARDERDRIRRALEERFSALYAQLGVAGTADAVARIVPGGEMHRPVQDFEVAQ